ncbi:UNVERIFIED_CONTAM: Retrovirus-related Pol polyprotein from transposon TNT 1-94 [Sesamum radiatum]|uniref:Retrovirus-related Pol polyprotein from transposon TNT 1-94 n=1 Tax=Sesamum radiatum TaxID=300843 RepID=A0AAW2JVR9_SESRA
MLIKKHISKGIRGSIPKCTKVKDFLKTIEDQYVCSDKALTSTLMKRLSDVKYNGSRSVREYIMHMRDIAAQLKPLEVDISEPFLVHLIVKSLRKEYGPFKITYNAQKKKWPVNELLTMCVQEEERLKNENIEVANPVTQNKGKGKKGKFGPYEKKTGNMSNEAFGNKITCFFCRKTGHKKKDCPKYKKWLEKKGNLISCGFLSLRKPMGSEQNIYSGNQMRSQVEDVGTFRLVFKNGYVLDLKSPFAAFLKEEGIIAQYTMPGTPQQNGVAERRNENSKGYRFYCPSHIPRIVEARNAKLLEDLETSGSNIPRKKVFEEDQVSAKTLRELTVYPGYSPSIKGKQSNKKQSPTKDNENVEPSTLNNQNQDENVEVRRSSRVKKSTISSDYIVYLQETDFDIGLENDTTSFSQAISSENFNLWHNAMKEEITSMDKNQVWELTKLPEGAKPIGCKWVYKTKRNLSGRIERYKARLVAKGYTKKEGTDYRETFSPVSKKDSFRIIIALVAHFDSEVHQMDMKTTFLNGDLEEEVYMSQPEGFSHDSDLVCKLNKSIYGLKQASRQCLMYVQVCTRPNIAFAVGMLGSYQSNPGIEHWKAAKKVMRHLQGTKDLQLIYKHTENLEVVGYSDSNFAGCLDTHKSTSGYIFLLANGAISWKSTKQTITASSTMEAEFVACYEATSQALWLRHFITGLKIVDSIFKPI